MYAIALFTDEIVAAAEDYIRIPRTSFGIHKSLLSRYRPPCPKELLYIPHINGNFIAYRLLGAGRPDLEDVWDVADGFNKKLEAIWSSGKGSRQAETNERNITIDGYDEVEGKDVIREVVPDEMNLVEGDDLSPNDSETGLRRMHERSPIISPPPSASNNEITPLTNTLEDQKIKEQLDHSTNHQKHHLR